jgi:RHS repeat-associated protein
MSRLFLPALLLLAAAGSAPAADAPLRAKPAATDVQWSTGAYSYDGSGNVTTIGPGTDGYTDTYGYDLHGRLLSSTTRAVAQTFTYDPLGNLRFVGNASGTGLSMPINPVTNRIDGTDPIGSNVVTAGYDEAGNETVHNGTYHYAFDGAGMVATLTEGGRAERYLYDADDQRIASVSAGGPTQRWRYTLRDLDAHFVREYVDDVTAGTHAWRWTRDYVHAGGRPVGTIAAKGAGGGEERRHFHLDHLGTPRLITADDGTILSRRSLLPFGEEITTPDESEVIAFTGHERDYAPGTDTNDLDYMHARYYAPRMGRFLSVDPGKDRDPHQPQSWNMYAYVRNNPLIATDPTGQWGWSDFKQWVGDTRAGITTWWHNRWHDEIPAPADRYDAVVAGEAADLAPQDAAEIGNPQARWANARAEAGAILSDEATSEAMTWGVAKAAGYAGIIVFGHGARHLIGTALEREAVEEAITNEINFVSREASQTGSFWGRVTVKGQVVEYRAFTLPDGTIRVGTYYTPKP